MCVHFKKTVLVNMVILVGVAYMLLVMTICVLYKGARKKGWGSLARFSHINVFLRSNVPTAIKLEGGGGVRPYWTGH